MGELYSRVGIPKEEDSLPIICMRLIQYATVAEQASQFLPTGRPFPCDFLLQYRGCYQRNIAQSIFCDFQFPTAFVSLLLCSTPTNVGFVTSNTSYICAPHMRCAHSWGRASIYIELEIPISISLYMDPHVIDLKQMGNGTLSESTPSIQKVLNLMYYNDLLLAYKMKKSEPYSVNIWLFDMALTSCDHAAQ